MSGVNLSSQANQALENINRNLQDGIFDGVSDAEVQQIATELKQLSAADANQVIQALSKSGKLEKFADEAMGAGVFDSGLSPADRQSLFNTLAGQVGGKEMAMVSNAFAKSNAGQVQEIAQSVSQHASPAAKLDYIQALAPRATDNQSRIDSGLGYVSTVAGDAEAKAIGTVLGSLKGNELGTAYTKLDQAQRDAVWKAAGQATSTSYGEYSDLSTSLPADGQKNLLNLFQSAQKITDPAQRGAMLSDGLQYLNRARHTDQVNAADIGKVSQQLIQTMDGKTIKSLSTDQAATLARNAAADGKALQTSLQHLLKLPASAQREVMLVSAFGATTPKQLASSPELRALTAQALGAAYAPGNATAVKNLQAALETDAGRKLIAAEGVAPGSRLWAVQTAMNKPAEMQRILAKAGDDPWSSAEVGKAYAQAGMTDKAQTWPQQAAAQPGQNLNNFIGSAMNAQPTIKVDAKNEASIRSQLAEGKLNAYAGDKSVAAVAAGVEIARKELNTDTPLIAVVPVQYSSKQTGPVDLPLFRVENAQGQSRFVDNTGRVYKDFADWEGNNKLPPGNMTYPAGGQLNAQGNNLVSKNTPDTVDSVGEHLWSWTKGAALVGGTIAGGIVIGAAIIGTGGTIVVIAGGVALASGGVMAIDGATNLADRAAHGQSVADLTDASVRGAWIDIASGTLPVVGKVAGSTAKLVNGTVRATDTVSDLGGNANRILRTTAAVETAANVGGRVIDGVGFVDQGTQLAQNWEKLSPQDRTMGLLQMGFYAGMGGASAAASRRNGMSFGEMFNVKAEYVRTKIQHGATQTIDPSSPGGARVDNGTGSNVQVSPSTRNFEAQIHRDIGVMVNQGERGLATLAKQHGLTHTPRPKTVAGNALLETEKFARLEAKAGELLNNPKLSTADRQHLEMVKYQAGVERNAWQKTLSQLDANPSQGRAHTDAPVEAPSLGRQLAESMTALPPLPANMTYVLPANSDVLHARGKPGFAQGTLQRWDADSGAWISTKTPVVQAQYTGSKETSNIGSGSVTVRDATSTQVVDLRAKVDQAVAARATYRQDFLALKAKVDSGQTLSASEVTQMKASYSGMIRSSENIGELGAVSAVLQQYPTAKLLTPSTNSVISSNAPTGSGKLDLVFEVPGAGKNGRSLIIVVEAKGGSADLGSRQVGDDRYQQGHPAYLDEQIRLSANYDPALNQTLSSARRSGNLEYYKAQTPIDANTGAGTVELRQFDLRNPNTPAPR